MRHNLGVSTFDTYIYVWEKNIQKYLLKKTCVIVKRGDRLRLVLIGRAGFFHFQESAPSLLELVQAAIRVCLEEYEEWRLIVCSKR